jgi:amino acid transporter
MVLIAPIAPWGTFAYVYRLAAGATVLPFLIGVAAMFFTAWSYKEMADHVAGAGSAYAYARQAMGARIGFLTGWMLLLDYLLLPALFYVLGAVALASFMPMIPRWSLVLIFGAFSLAANWFGIRTTGRISLVFLLVQLAMVALWMLGAFWALHWSLSALLPLDALANSRMSFGGIFAAASLCILVFLGFDAVTTLSEEMRPEQRPLVGRAVIIVLAICGALFVMQAWAMSGVASGFTFTDPASGAYDMTRARVSYAGGVAMAWSMALILVLAVTPPALAAVSRVLQAMGAARHLPEGLARLHPRHRIPHIALLFSTGLSTVVALLLVDDVDKLSSMVNLGALSAFFSVHLSLLTWLFVKQRSGRWLAHCIAPLVGMAIILVLIWHMSPLALITAGVWFATGLTRVLLLKPTAIAAPMEV